VNLFLIGYRGTGKTVTGRRVANALGKEFVDTDNLIVELAGKSIPKIFEEDGEVVFREWETKALVKASENENQIISCGGGIITQERNFEILAKGVVCLLSTTPELIYNRIYKDGNRPALTDKGPMAEIIHLLEVREPRYQCAKDFEVKCASRNVSECTNEVIKKFKEFNVLKND